MSGAHRCDPRCVECEVDGLPLSAHDLERIAAWNAAAVRLEPMAPHTGGPPTSAWRAKERPSVHAARLRRLERARTRRPYIEPEDRQPVGTTAKMRAGFSDRVSKGGHQGIGRPGRSEPPR